MDDATLVVAARDGDRDAFAAIYDRYADRIHDFCCSVLRERAEAADAMQDTFLAAARKLAQLRDPSKLRAWLFAIARHESLRRAKARTRAVPTCDFPDLAASGAGPEDEVRRSDLTEIVWAAAAGLSERDRVLLDLHLRQGLDGQELADTIGVTAGHAYVLMNRLRGQVERALGALLVARLGRDDCATLAGILRGWDGTFSVLIRKRVARHVDGCDLCSKRRAGLVSPLSLLSAVPMIPAAAVLRDRVLSRIELASASSPVGDPGGTTGSRSARAHLSGGGRRRSDGFPPPMIASRAAHRVAAVTAAAVIAGGFGGGAFLALRDGSRNGIAVAAAAPATSTTDATSYVTSPATTRGGGRTTTTSASSDSTTTTSMPGVTTTTAAGAVAPTVAPPTTAVSTPSTTATTPSTAAPTTTATAPATTVAPTTTTAPIDDPPLVEIVRVTNPTIYQTTGGCTPNHSYFEATATDDRSTSHVRISWESDSGRGSGRMSLDNDRWYGSVGPFDDVYGAKPDDVNVTVTAWDSAHQFGATYYTITLVYEIC